MMVINLNNRRMGMREQDSTNKYQCDYCDQYISILTKRLQQHSTSDYWQKHGQCCAACAATGEVRGINNARLTPEPRHGKSSRGNVLWSGNHNNNIILALARAAEIEEKTEQKIRKQSQITITSGKIIIAFGLAGGFIFFYYEYFTIAIIGIIISIAGLVLYRLGVWNKYRINK